MSTFSFILFATGCVLLFFSLLIKNSNFLDIRWIFCQHFSIFQGNPLQFVSIFIAPALLSIGMAEFKCINKDILNNLNIVLSILVSMFFSILGILCSFEKENENSKYLQLLKETFNTTIFEIILCLILLLVSFILLFFDSYEKTLLIHIVSGFVYYLTIVTILNILVVIKRIKVLFDNK